MSTQAPDATDAAHATVLDHEVFEQELKQANALVMAERPFDQYSPDVLLQVRINLPVSIVLARYIERFELRRLWYSDEEQWAHGYSVPGMNLIAAHRTYPQRDTVILTFTQPMAIWRKLQLSQVSRSITFLECVTEDNVVGDLQMTYLLTRASRRVNEGPLSMEQFKDDMRRACLAIFDGKWPPGVMGLTLPQVLFTASFVTEYLPLDDDGKISWQDIDRNFNSTRSACPKVCQRASMRARRRSHIHNSEILLALHRSHLRNIPLCRLRRQGKIQSLVSKLSLLHTSSRTRATSVNQESGGNGLIPKWL